MILKPHHRAILRAAPLYGHIPLALRREKGFHDLVREKMVVFAHPVRKEWSFIRPQKLSPAGRACKRLLEEIPVDEEDK